MYEIYEQLLQEHGITSYKVSKDTGIAQSVLSSWKNGNSKPKPDKLKKIAEYFNVSIEYLMGGEDPNAIKFEKEKIIQAYHKGEQGYYLDPRAAEIAQEIANNKELGGLFDAARNASPEDLLTVQTMLEALKKKG